nr:ribonuclease H-like domain-containing protein [Tanacetum cinerariifolium]
LPDEYENVFDIGTHREPFLDLKMACFLLTTEEMRLKYKSQALPVDSSSSSHMIFLAESGNTRRSSAPQVKSWRSCYNFAKGSCHFAGKHVRLPFVGSSTSITSCFDIVHSDAVEILERAHMVNFNPSRTPVDTESKLGEDGDLISDSTLYQSLACSLQYLTFTRPDISYDVHQAGCPTTRRSTTGYCVFLDNNLLSWSSKRQPTLIRFSAYTEYCSVVSGVAETCWLRNLLRELHTPLSSTTLVYCENV